MMHTFLLYLFILFLSAPLEAAPLSEGQLVGESLAAVSRHYVDPERVRPLEMLTGGLEEISDIVPEIFVDLQQKEKFIAVTVGVSTKRFSTESLQSLKDLKRVIKEILAFIDVHYAGNVEKKKIEHALIDGLLNKLDPHSSFLPPEYFQEFKVGAKGEFGGLGIVVGMRGGMLTVIAPLDGTPAAKAGVRSRDRIMQIDDASTINMSLNDAVNRMRGEIGSIVRLIIQRADQSIPLKLTLKRALINIDSVQAELMTDAGKRIGYLKIKSFQENTDADMRKALQSFQKEGQNIAGLILDLRNNPGGLLDQSIAVADHFLEGGTIVSTVASYGRLLERSDATRSPTEAAYPIVVLINEGSASASEIVAGALQANNRAVVIGRRSFGKGSVQTIFELSDDSALKLTIAQYLAAGKKRIQLIGVTPDIELKPVFADKKGVNLIEDTMMLENDLEQHLEEQPKMIEHPRLTISYLDPKGLPLDSEGSDDDAYKQALDLAQDFSVNVAKRLLLAAPPASDRNVLLKISEQLEKKMGEEEGKKISAALQELQIDWQEIPQSGNPVLRIHYTLRQSGATKEAMRAGEEALLELTATNIGTGPFCRLIGVGGSKLPFLANKEFVFGTLAPKATKAAAITIKVPEGIPSQEALMNIEFQDCHNTAPRPLEAVVPIQGAAAPQFAFSYGLKGKRAATVATGKTVKLSLDIINVGTGKTSEEAVATLSNKSGDSLFLTKGRIPIGVLEPQQKKSDAFEFRLASEFAEKSVELELTLIDPKHGQTLSKSFHLGVDGTLSPVTNGQYRPPNIDVTSPHKQTSRSTLEVKGLVVDDKQVKDYVVFVANKKIMYTPAPSDARKIPFAVTVPLEVGNNIVTIAARDDDDLLGRRSIVIRRIADGKQL